MFKNLFNKAKDTTESQNERPKLYDKNGNEVTGRPEPGVTYYDANGNELKAPQGGHGGPQGGHGGPQGGHGGHGGPHGERQKLYDKDGNEVTGRPEQGVTYYDADGNELKAPQGGHGGPQGGHGGPHGGHGGPQGERPKLYDKDGNEVTGRPEEGVTYYDANGNELKAPQGGQGGPGPKGGQGKYGFPRGRE